MAEKRMRNVFGDFSRERLALMALAIGGIALVFLFQGVDVLNLCGDCSFHPYTRFAARKIIRVLLNDSLMLLFIHSLFRDARVTRLAWYVQLVDTFVLLPVYLLVKLSYEGDEEISMPLLSQLHRLIVNPTLMVLLIPAVYYQRASAAQKQ